MRGHHNGGRPAKMYRGFGVELSLKDWADISGLNAFCIRARIQAGSSVEDAVVYRGRDFPEGAWEERGKP